MRVGDIAAGRAGDKGDVLDLTLVARDDASYAIIAHALTAEVAAAALNRIVPGCVQRYELPRLRALKFVSPVALPGGVHASLRAGCTGRKRPFGCCSTWSSTGRSHPVGIELVLPKELRHGK